MPLEYDALAVERIRGSEVIAASGGKGQLLGVPVGQGDPVDSELPRTGHSGNKERLAVLRPGTVSHGRLVVESTDAGVDQLSRLASI